MSDRIYHHYEKLEEYHAGMWRRVSGEKRKEHIANAADLMKAPADFRDAMMRAIDEWPMSCEANLTAEVVNRIAWLGHAGCCIVANAPEDCTRSAWHTLDRFEQDVANKMADEVLTIYLGRNKTQQTLDLFDVVMP
jgi:hypothetical protein